MSNKLVFVIVVLMLLVGSVGAHEELPSDAIYEQTGSAVAVGVFEDGLILVTGDLVEWWTELAIVEVGSLICLVQWIEDVEQLIATPDDCASIREWDYGDIPDYLFVRLYYLDDDFGDFVSVWGCLSILTDQSDDGRDFTFFNCEQDYERETGS